MRLLIAIAALSILTLSACGTAYGTNHISGRAVIYMAQDVHGHLCTGWKRVPVKYGGIWKPGDEDGVCHGPDGFTPVGVTYRGQSREIIWLEDR